MRTLARNLVLAITLLAFTGCATTRTLEAPTAENIQQQVEPGDVVKIRVKDGRSFEIEVEKVEADSLTGSTIENRRFRIPYAMIDTVQIQGDTAGAAAGAGGMILVGTVLVLAAVIAFGEDFWDYLTDPNHDD